MMVIQMIMMDVHLYVLYKPVMLVVPVMVGPTHGVMNLAPQYVVTD
jgi:hypothetical protein